MSSDILIPMDEAITRYLDALKRDECYRIDSILKENGADITQKVYFVGANGSEQGPYIRKYLGCEKGNGREYERIFAAQMSGIRFLHIPRIIDWYMIDESTAVIVSEYVEGQTLEQLVSEQGGSYLLANSYFKEVCEAALELHYKFDPPIIHRDFKPSNIIVNNGNVNIIDFGIARSYKKGMDSDTTHFGTRAYAPPEQYGFGQTDFRSDVYALGLILYYLLTSDVPDANARQRSYSSPKVPEPLRKVIVRATMIDPEERYANVRELQEAFITEMSSINAQVDKNATPSFVPSPSQALDASRTLHVAPVIPSAPAAQIGMPCKEQANNGILSRIPKGFGIAWDCFLGVMLTIMLIAGISCTFFPAGTTELDHAPLAIRALAYTDLVVFMLPSIGYLICDRRPLRKLSFFARLRKNHRDILIAAGMFIFGIFIIGLATVL